MSAAKHEPERGGEPQTSAATESETSVSTTNRSVVRATSGKGRAQPREARLMLAERYRAPVRAYLLSCGYAESGADGLVERFFVQLACGNGPTTPAGNDNEPLRVWLLRELEGFVSSDPDPTRAEAETATPARASRMPAVSGYDVIEKLGVGGEGAVYRAYDLRAQRQVALKLLHPEHLQEPEVVERFRKSVALASTLEHPNIVRIYDIGSPSAPEPYCTMQLVVGGTLAERQKQELFRTPERAARLVIKIARAVHHAHQRGILHRDISPANVLLDSNDEPFLADFMAKRVRQAGPSTAVGKFAYAAPEVAEGHGGTVETDVYGLGAILYELWTGVRPVEGASFDEVQRRHEEGPPKPVRALVPEVSREMESVCLAALSRDPKERHASAANFADSLERALAKFPPLWPKVSRPRRAGLWIARHPLLAVGALLGALVLLAADWLTLASVRAQRAEIESATLHANAALASSQARAVLALFEKLASEAVRTASHAELREFLERDRIGTVAALQSTIESTRSFDTAAVFSRDGRIMARYPDPPPNMLGREFRFREYYQCVDALAKRSGASEGRRQQLQVCLSPAYRGEASGQIEFTIAAPVYSAADVVGFVILNKHAKNTLEEIEIDDAYQSGQTTALFGLRGRDRTSNPEGESIAKSLTAVAHPGLFSSEERALDAELSRKLLQRFAVGSSGGQLRPVRVRPWEEANYVDPVTKDERLAGFAPVGATGFVVSVSTPRAKALGASERHIDALWRYALLLNVGFLILGGIAWWSSLRDDQPGTLR